MSRLFASMTTSLVLGMLVGVPLGAQQVPWLSFDTGFGLGYGFGGPVTDNRDLFVISANVSMAVYRTANNAVVLATGIQTHTATIGQRACEPAPDRQCPHYPGMSSRVMLLGYARALSARHTLRILAGPARVRHAFSESRGSGAVALVDLTMPFTRNMDMAVFGQGLVAPSWQSKRYGTMAFGIAVRARTSAR